MQRMGMRTSDKSGASDAEKAGSGRGGRSPSFEAEGVTLYLGDGNAILPTLPPGLVYVTDQPYGTGWVRGGGKKAGEFKAAHEKPDWDVWDLGWLALLNSPKRIAAFCPVGKCEELCNALPQPMVMHYRKSNVRPGGVDREPIVVSPPCVPREWKKLAYNGDMPLHPCQKPLDVMLWLVESVSEEGDTVADNFMGSASTAIACIRTGRKFIGIERDPEHFETAVRRISAELAQGSLFRAGGGGAELVGDDDGESQSRASSHTH
jgi:hypothetical protein